MHTPPMRRSRQLLSEEDTLAVLRRGTNGVLALNGEDGYPYAVPVSYVYDDGVIYIHGAQTGYKLSCIARSEKVSFCVVDEDTVVPEKFTTYFRSAIVFGTARVLTDPAEIRGAISLIGRKYWPETTDAALEAEIAGGMPRMSVIALTVEQATGKEAIEYVRRKNGEA